MWTKHSLIPSLDILHTCYGRKIILGLLLLGRYWISHFFLVFLFNVLRTSLVPQLVTSLPANSGDTRDMGLIPGSRRFIGEGNGNTIQYSCLENSMNRGAWQVHGVAKSWTQLLNIFVKWHERMESLFFPLFHVCFLLTYYYITLL